METSKQPISEARASYLLTLVPHANELLFLLEELVPDITDAEKNFFWEACRAPQNSQNLRRYLSEEF